MACEDKLGTSCPPTDDNLNCRPWQLTLSRDQCYIDSLVNEALAIAGADLHVFKLLGVHEQGLLQDLTGDGNPISGGDSPTYSVSNAFNATATEWHSLQKGSDILASAYLGYDFGIIKLDNGRARYGIDTSIRHHITTIKIKQSADATKRVTKARIERSEDGQQWYGVAIIDLPDNGNLNTISFKHSTHMRYWRIRPVTFNGGVNDYWGIIALQLIDFDSTSLNNIQDKIFLENRDRDYMGESINLKGYYDLIDVQSELTRFGIELPSQTYSMQINFNSCVALLGRPIVIGDIIELPSETQYTSTLQPIKKFLEVTDVTWSVTGYTPGWVPTLLRVTTQPVLATQETQDIFGDLAPKVDSSGLFNIDDGNHPMYQDHSAISQEIQQQAITNVPEHGIDGKGAVHQFTPEELQTADANGYPMVRKLGLNNKALYVEDAMPPNGLPYTEADIFPTSPTNGDYHRLTYTGLAHDIPPRLYRFSSVKNRWIYLETDKRQVYNREYPILREFVASPNAVPADQIK